MTDVSIICWAYNHEKYIRQCLDGFVMQKDVTFEIIIHDDASTDHTADIIREYENRYPKLFKPIYQSKNQYSQNIDIAKEYMLPLITGKYVAVCEGDDYWTDPYKLKKQFDALESNPDCHMCLHRVEIVNEDGTSANKEIPTCSFLSGRMTSDQFFETYKYTRYFHTTSFFFLAKKYKEYRNNPPAFRRVAPVGDEAIIMYFAFIGNVYYIDMIMSNYRFQSNASWSSFFHANTKESWRIRENHIFKMRKMMEEFLAFTNGQYRKELSFKIEDIDNCEKVLRDDKFWYCINNKDYKQLFKEFSITELRKYDLSNKALIKLKLQAIFSKKSK